MLPGVEYLGYIISADGIQPSAEKVRALMEAPRPENTTQLRSFLGLLNFYNKFLPQSSTWLAPLHQLLKQNAKWAWGKEQDLAFKKAQEALLSSDVLVHYNQDLPLILECDASPYGVGAVLSHEMEDGSTKPVSFASRSLTPTEKRYAHLDKEALAIIFGVKRFHLYLAGRKFSIVSDHRPLQYLFAETKPVPAVASAGIQHWALTLSAYDYTIRYKPGP
ncbi:MAG: Ty3/Gypsy family RNase HI domain-containing protein, partial [Alphaproteobacteria bacterium]|nr:Ty3/Gypsy family RNase HI domain-containing protein [Alphaproteobacteria bacterium]